MATIPLYTRAAHPDAWHQVAAPGGYEWWYFDAEDPEHDRQIVAILFQGFVFHPGYLRRWARYRRRPTRVPPPMPAEYPCAYFVVYERGRIAHQFMTQYPPRDFTAATDALDVAVGPNRVQRTEPRCINLTLQGTPWRLTWQGPKLLDGQALSADFCFRPRFDHLPNERVFLSRELSGAEHHWVVADPLCDVTGTIRPPGAAAPISFTGVGYHDHNYGTAPLGPGLRKWIWGRLLTNESACTFHFARPRDGQLEDEVHLVEADATGVREQPVAVVEGDWSRLDRSSMLRYPEVLRFENQLWLSAPRVIDASPFYLRLMYDARHGPRRGRAFCEIAYPRRLRWPLLGRMIELSIDRKLP